MKTSESIVKIAEALCDFQMQVKDAPKDSQAHKYKYADLGTILELVRPVMASNSLSVVQMTCNEEDRVGVTTRLMHVSGEWVESTLFMGVSANAGMSLAQAAGSVITYCRRYSLASALGITQVDDDAVAAPPKKAPPKKEENLASKEQKEQLVAFKADGCMSPRRMAWCKNVDNWNALTSANANTIIDECELLKREKEELKDD